MVPTTSFQESSECVSGVLATHPWGHRREFPGDDHRDLRGTPNKVSRENRFYGLIAEGFRAVAAANLREGRFG